MGCKKEVDEYISTLNNKPKIYKHYENQNYGPIYFFKDVK